MRELKFRVWDLQRKYFSSEYDIYCSNGSVSCSGRGIVDPNRHRFAPQQYTGLKDKNGVEIYEGDIVSGKFYDTDYMSDVLVTCPVKWIEQSASFNIGHHYWTRASIKIIGNIFENPELLEQ